MDCDYLSLNHSAMTLKIGATDLSVIPSESSVMGQSVLRVLFQYLLPRVSKYRSFCSSRITLLISS